LKALRRRWPGEDIHLVVRERFQEAAWAAGDAGVTVHALPSAAILAPLLNDDDSGAVNLLEQFVNQIRAAKPAKIINLSFSPFSSYLTEALSGDGVEVTGYTRFHDGYLKIPDDTSAYFYAQAGIGRHNRYHVSEIFAAVAGVDLEPADFSLPVPRQPKSGTVLVHIGASQAEKSYPPEQWREVLTSLSSQVSSIVVVGSANERAMAGTVCAGLSPEIVRNRVGDSSIQELCHWAAESALVIGADSAPVHIAALTGTPVLNLSCHAVNFWETGPLSAGSRVLLAPKMQHISARQVVSEALAMLEGRGGNAHAVRPNLLSPFELRSKDDDFFWRMLQALYTAADYPELPEGASALAFQRLFETADLALQQIRGLDEGHGHSQRLQILQSVDQILEQLPKHDPRVAPIVGWFQTERLRIGPVPAAGIIARTRDLFEQLLLISAVYHRPSVQEDLRHRARELAVLCAPALREFDFQDVQDHFQELLSVLQELSRHTTKVGDKDWSSVLSGVQSALARRDFVELADTLEFDLDVIL